VSDARGRRGLHCDELVELVTAYLDGALAPHERRRFAEHVAACDGCAAYLAQFEATIAAVAATRRTALDPAARDALLRVFRGFTA
jgi:anti-sigma factor RsiW